MATKTSGGRIRARTGLTFEAQDALEVGDKVMVTGDYECEKFDAVGVLVGRVVVANKTRVAGAFPVDQVPGDVTVDVRGGGMVTKEVADAAIVAGVYATFNADGEVVVAGVGEVGPLITLTAAADPLDPVDVLWI